MRIDLIHEQFLHLFSSRFGKHFCTAGQLNVRQVGLPALLGGHSPDKYLGGDLSGCESIGDNDKRCGGGQKFLFCVSLESCSLKTRLEPESSVG